MNRPPHARHGIHDPTGATPPRARGSIRRTSTIDMLRPDGLLGDVVLVGRARDLATSEPGGAPLLGEASILARVAFPAERTLAALATVPPESGAATLIGVKTSSGF